MGGLAVCDISDKRSPSLLTGSFCETGCFGLSGSGAMALEGAQGNYVLMCAGGNGFGMFDITNEPKRRGEALTTGVLSGDGGCGILIKNDIVYLAGGHGLGILDLKLLKQL